MNCQKTRPFEHLLSTNNNAKKKNFSVATYQFTYQNETTNAKNWCQSSLSDLIIKSESLLDFEQKLAYLTSDNSLGFFLVVFWTANWWHINKHVNYCPFFLLLTNQTSRYTQSNTHKLCYLHCAQFARILLCCFVGTLSHETLKHSFAKPLFLI